MKLTPDMMRDRFDALVAATGPDARRLSVLATTAAGMGANDRAHALAVEARGLAPDDPEIAVRTRHVIADQVPHFHAGMLNDTARNAAFERAIVRAAPGARVLDIGAGSGLLSMMAARAGAAHVVACEMVAAVADVAREIVAANGYADRVEIVTGRSDRLGPEELGTAADVVVAEIVSDDLLGERIVPALADAARRLLRPGARMIPSAGDMMVALADWSPRAGQVIEKAAGFDVSAFGRLTKVPILLDVASTRLALRSDAAALFSITFGREPIAGGARRNSIALTATGGSVTGIVQWIRLTLDEEETYENRPGPDARSHWRACYYPLPAPMTPAEGRQVTVSGAHNDTGSFIWMEPAAA